jgi:predicted MFS family arabinose efflux permease
LWSHLQPLYIRYLGADPKEIGATLSLSGLLVIFLYIPVGVIADRWRRKPIIVAAWVLGTLAVLLIGLAPDWRWVIPAYAVHLLSSFSRPAVSAHVAATDISANPSRTFAFLWTGFSIGAIVSPSLGGWIAETWGLRVVFFVATGIGVISTLLIMGIRDGAANPHRTEVKRAGLGQLLRDWRFLQQIGLMLAIVFALELGTVLAPNYLQEVKGLSLQEIGGLGSLASLGMFALTLTLGYMRNDRRMPFLLNQGLVLLGLLCLLLAPGGWVLHPLLLAGYFLRGGGRAVVPLTRGRISLWLPPDRLSAGFGFVDTAAQTATLLAPLAAGLLYEQGPAWPLMAGVMALAVTMALTTVTRSVRETRAPAPVAAASGSESST